MDEGGVPPPGGGRTDGKPFHPSAAGRWAAAQRAGLLALQLPLFLPFVVTRSCTGGEIVEMTGIGYYAAADRAVFLLALLVVLGALLASPWRGERGAGGAAGLGLRAWGAALGAIVAGIGPYVAFLFEEPQPRIGWILHGGGWALAAAAGTVGAAVLLARAPPALARGPERFGVAALVAAPLLAAAARAARGTDAPVEILAAFGLGAAVAAPLAVAGLAIARGGGAGARRIAWWAAAVLTALFTLGAGLED